MSNKLVEAAVEFLSRDTSSKQSKEIDEGILSSVGNYLLDKKTPQEVANSAISAINKKAPGTKMHKHPNFSKFKQEVHKYVSSAKSGSEAVKRSSDDHVSSLAKKHFNEEVTKMDTPTLKKWITTRQRNAMGGNLSKQRRDEYDKAQAELKKRNS